MEPSDYPRVRGVDPAEVGALSRVLSRAFHDDPVFGWMFPDPSARPKKSAALFEILSRMTLKHGAAFTTDALQGAALWEFMEAAPAGMIARIPSALRMVPIFGPRTLTVLRGGTRLTAAHPKTPHWYLLALGVDPGNQRTGVGTALVAPTVARCDAEGVTAYLEASRESNIPFYQRLGFAVTKGIRLPNGPTVYGMLRRPKNAQETEAAPRC